MFTPVLRIGKHWQAPQREGFQIDLTGEKFLKQASKPPGEMTRLRLSPIAKETQYIEDPLAGQIPFRFREISPEYSFRWINTAIEGPMAWLQVPIAAELEQRKIARTTIRLGVDALLEKADKEFIDALAICREANKMEFAQALDYLKTSFDKLDVPEQKQLCGGMLQLELLDDKGTGFLETVPDFYECGASGVRWNFAVPNVEKMMVSAWPLQQDQKQCFRLVRMHGLEEQVKHQFEIILGNGHVQYGLVFTKDEAITFRHYRDRLPNNKPVTPKMRSQWETELQAVIETGELTADDNAFIAQQQAEINKIKKQSTATGNSKLSEADQKKTDNLQKKIDERKASKNGLTDVMARAKARLLKLLYYDEKQVSLQEDARSLYNQPINITFGFHRKGFISIRIGLGAEPGKEPFYYELENITKTRQLGTILPGGSHVLIRSNGGAFGLAWGVADHAPLATLYSHPFPIPFLFNPDEWSVTLDGVGLREADIDPSEPLRRLPRCRVDGRRDTNLMPIPPLTFGTRAFVEEVEPGKVDDNRVGPDGQPFLVKPPKVRVCLDFISEAHPKPSDPYAFDPYVGNHDYGAEVYRATVVCVAGEPPDFTEIEWDSTQQGFPIEDMQMESSLDRGATHTMFLRDNTRRAANLPDNLENRWAEVGLLDMRPGENRGQYLPLVWGGVVREPSSEDLRRFIASVNETPDPGPGVPPVLVTGIVRDGKRIAPSKRLSSMRRLMVAGLESKLDVPVRVPLIGNDKWPGNYIYEMLAIHGFSDALLGSIPEGRQDGLFKLPSPPPGEYPDIRPATGESLWSALQDMVGKHCLGWRLRCDPLEGVVFERALYRDQAQVNYSTGVGHNHLYSVQRAPQGETTLRLWQDTREFWPEAIFLGAWNPGGSQRFSSSYRLWEATNRRDSLYYTGERKIYRARPDDSLSSQVRCDLAARQFQSKFGLPPWYASWLAWYDPARREGDLIRIDGLKVVVQSIAYPRFQKGLEQKMNITVRVFEDVGLV